MKRQVIKTNWREGKEPRHEYEDKGPSGARSRPEQLDGTNKARQGRLGERGGRVKHASPREGQ